MELTINVQVGVSPEVVGLVRKAVAMIMPVRQSAEMPTPTHAEPVEEVLPAEEAPQLMKVPTMEDVRSAVCRLVG